VEVRKAGSVTRADGSEEVRQDLSIRRLAVRVEGEPPGGGDTMARYMLGIYQPVGDPPPPEVLEPIMRDLEKVNEEMRAAGAWVFAAGLHDPSTATVLRAQEGEVLVTDGPFAEGKEHLGGFTIIEAPDLDAALEWGRKVARALTLPIEVRPLHFGTC
jgi:hypothetical protein